MKVDASERLIYELMDESHANDLYELDQDPEVMRYITDGKISTWETINDVLIPRMLRYRNPELGWGIWRVALKDSNEFIGWVLVRPMNFFSQQRNDNDIELGWRFKRSTWGQGFATEAATQVMRALEQQCPPESFSAIAIPDNHGSINVMTKLGMNYIKTDWHRDPIGDVKVVFYTRELGV